MIVLVVRDAAAVVDVGAQEVEDLVGHLSSKGIQSSNI